jgi:hypothetical protein
MERLKDYLVSPVLALEALHVHWIAHHWLVAMIPRDRGLSQIDCSGTGKHVAEPLVYSSPVLQPLKAIHFQLGWVHAAPGIE